MTLRPEQLMGAVATAKKTLKLKSAERGQVSIDFRERYWSRPDLFVEDCIDFGGGSGATEYQKRILRSIVEQKRVAVRGPHGLGKTALSSWVILWFALTRDGKDWKAPTTASSWRQLVHYLWPEVHKWARRVRWDVVGRPPFRISEMLDRTLKLHTGEAFASASDNPALIEGAHADYLLYMFDEAKTIPGETFDAAEGAFSGAGGDTAAEAIALAVSTPGEPSGRFYEIHARRPGYEDWFVHHVTLEDCIAAGRVSREWADQRLKQWGADSAIYANRVLGEFATSEEDTVIPLAWVELANERWLAWKDTGQKPSFTCVGVDVARSGEDMTVLALRHGNVIAELRRYSKEDTMATTGRVRGILAAYSGRAIVDVIGVGAGVVDRLKEDKMPVVAFNASERSEDKDHSGELGFVNKRSAAWWRMRELLDPTNGHDICLPPDDLLTGDLTSPHWRVVSGGRIQVEGKDDIKKRLGRSTDDGDAVVMAFEEPKKRGVFVA